MYIPSLVPTNPAEIPAFLNAELLQLASALQSTQQFLLLDTLYGAPTKPREGMIVKADGTTWNPGSGSGVYVYRGAAWHLLG